MGGAAVGGLGLRGIRGSEGGPAAGLVGLDGQMGHLAQVEGVALPHFFIFLFVSFSVFVLLLLYFI